jgi:hypothetical protein
VRVWTSLFAFAFTALLLLSGIAAAEATFNDASNAISAADAAIYAADQAGNDVTAAVAKLDQASSKFRSSEYDAAVTLANEAKSLAESAPPKAGTGTSTGTGTTGSTGTGGTGTTGTTGGTAGTGGTEGTQQTGTGDQQGTGQEAGQGETQPPAASEQPPVQQGTPEPAPSTGPNWLLIAIVFGAAGFGTLLFLALAWFFFLRRRY